MMHKWSKYKLPKVCRGSLHSNECAVIIILQIKGSIDSITIQINATETCENAFNVDLR